MVKHKTQDNHISSLRRCMDAFEFNHHLKHLKTNVHSVEKLYDFYYSRIIQYLSKKYGCELAKDVAQEFFINLFNISEKQGYVSYPTSWVYTCCDNIAKRKVCYESRCVPTADMRVKDDFLSEEQLYGDLYAVIKLLDDDSQRIIKLFYWEGYSLKEISQILDIKPATIRKKHIRAIKKMKKLINDVTKFK